MKTERSGSTASLAKPASGGVHDLLLKEYRTNKPQPTKEQMRIFDISPKKRGMSAYSKIVKN